MTWTITDRGANEASYITSMSAGDTFTPSQNDIIVVAASTNSSIAWTSVSGWGATWSQVGSIVGSSGGRLHVWAARIGASPGSDDATINFSSSNAASAVTFQIAGADASGSVSSIFLQNQTVANYNPTSPLAIPSLSSFASATNLSLSFGAMSSNNNFTPQSGWTEAAQASLGTNGFNVAAFYKDSEDTTQTVEGTLFSYRWVNGMGFEVAEASSDLGIEVFRRRIQEG